MTEIYPALKAEALVGLLWLHALHIDPHHVPQHLVFILLAAQGLALLLALRALLRAIRSTP